MRRTDKQTSLWSILEKTYLCQGPCMPARHNLRMLHFVAIEMPLPLNNADWREKERREKK